MSSYKIGVNLRVTENSNQGGRKYMEDHHAIRFVKNDEGGFEFAYFGIFDGHGGAEASKFARDHLLDEITKYDSFWSENDEDVLFAIKSGFIDTHFAMWKEVEKWPRTFSGYPSTSGTTGSIGIIKNSKLYIGHVGDSGIALGYDDSKRENLIRPKGTMLTVEHKPDSPEERKRIEGCGGQVVAKSGVQRVVWNRPKVTHKGPIRRSTPIDKIPFLAVARSLGDLWSYNYLNEEFVVSPSPDVSVHELDPNRDKCLVFGSDGLWNMMNAEEAISMVVDLEYHFEHRIITDPNVSVSYWINPAEKLVQRALNKWRAKLMRADNTSCIVILIDPLGPRKLSILRKKREENLKRLSEKQNSQEDIKQLTRVSPRKSHEHKNSENDSEEEQNVPIKTETSPLCSNQNACMKRKTMSDLDFGIGMSKPTLSPVSIDKLKRHSLPVHGDVNLDDSIQATSVHRKLSPPTPTSELLKTVTNSAYSLNKTMPHKRTRHHSGSALLGSNTSLSGKPSKHIANRQDHHKKETFTASALKDLSILTDSLQPTGSFSAGTLEKTLHKKPASHMDTCSFKDVQNIVNQARVRSKSGDIASLKMDKKLTLRDLKLSVREFKKDLKYDKMDCPSHNLRKPHTANLSAKKGTSIVAKLRRKVKQRPLRCRGQTENKAISLRKSSKSLKRKRDSLVEGASISKKACRR